MALSKEDVVINAVAVAYIFDLANRYVGMIGNISVDLGHTLPYRVLRHSKVMK